MKRISILIFIMMLVFSCTTFAADSQAASSDDASNNFKEYLISKALNTTYYFEPAPEENHITQLTDGQYYWQQFGSNCSLEKTNYVEPVVGVITINRAERNVVAWAAIWSGGGTGHFTEIMIAVEQPDGTMEGRHTVTIGDRIKCQKISITKNKVIVDYLDRMPNQGMATRPTIPKKTIITLND